MVLVEILGANNSISLTAQTNTRKWLHSHVNVKQKDINLQIRKYAAVHTCTHTRMRMHKHKHSNTKSHGHADLFTDPENSLMANLRENNHFSSVFVQQVGAFYVPAVKQH